MSGTPTKRLHEEPGVHSSAPKYPHDDSGLHANLGAKLTSSATNEYHPPFDIVQDARMSKITRTESRDVDRRSPLLPNYRMSSSSNDSHADYAVKLENRFELRDSKDNSRDHKIENRDTKPEPRELYHGGRGDKDTRFESRGEDNKETKYDRDVFSDYKGEMKTDKDGYGTGSSQLTWKEPKEHHRGKRYFDTTGGNVDSWHPSRSTVHGSAEVAKEGSVVEERDYVEVHEAVGENKVDLKGEDKFKEKDRKRKDGKHREWGERDKERSDRRNILQLGNSCERKEATRDEREAEKWEREKSDIVKDKMKDREKDHTKREACDGAEKEGLHGVKESIDVSRKALDQENSTVELKKQRDHDSWKNVDREGRDRRKERDMDEEGERPEKRSRCYDKELDDGCVDADGGSEKEREALNYGVQQRKRMLRPKGSPQLANREPRLRSHTPQEHEGSEGKGDISTVVYRVGECMQELIKLWKEHESNQADKSSESSQDGPTLEIRIPAEHVTATNRQVRGGQLWGTDIYTDDSDLVAVLMHTGYCRPTASPPPPAIQELRATIRVLPPQD
ncbi:hypothetical protein RJ640_026840, partial [Escallonia rubra]